MLKDKLMQVYAFEESEIANEYKGTIEEILNRLENYVGMLEKEYKLIDYPKAIVWTTSKLATNVFSTVPIPAYTNERFICITPEINTWKKIYGDINKQLPSKSAFEYYQNISIDFLVAMVGHEFTHHLDLFLDDFEDERYNGIWFEEGMCHYLSRRHLLNNDDFQRISEIEWEYIMYYKDIFGKTSIEEFGSKSYDNSMDRIMYEYCRSFHTVKNLVENLGQGNPKRIFELYKKWDDEGRKISLSEYFNIDILK